MAAPSACRSKPAWPVLVLLTLTVGCGPDRPGTIPVSGRVTLEGKPVAGAAVTFAPADGRRPATGLTDAEGRFTLATFADGDGALPGEHRVTVTKKEVIGATSGPDGLSGPIGDVMVKWIVPKPYSNKESSGLSAVVSRDRHEFTFDLTARD